MTGRAASGGARILVAGVGNIFLGDDGFGCEVARRLAGAAWPAEVKVEDFGTRSLHLALEITGGRYELVVLVDTCRLDQPPGTVALVDPDRPAGESMAFDGHGFDPASVLQAIATMGVRGPKVLIVACQPAQLDEGLGLSAVVEGAVEPAAALARDVVERHLAPRVDAMGGMTHVSGDSRTGRRVVL